MNEGLTQKEAEIRLKEFGKNHLPRPEKISSLSIFFSQFQSLIVWVLIIASGIAFFLGEWIDGSVIVAITFVNALLGFIQEWKSIRSIEELIDVERHLSKVIRDGALQKIPTDEIVPGDVVLLEAGDKVPADGMLIQATRFSVNEAALTGEAFPVAKALDQEVFRETVTVSGKGKFTVLKTGLKTEIGQIAKMLETIEERQTPLQKRLEVIGLKLVYLCLGIVAAIFFVGFLKGFPIYGLVMTSLSLAVAAIPEGLPAVVTIALAIGVERMVKKKALVRKLTAVETLGCTTVICTDKTGTLTENSMKVQKLWTKNEENRLLLEIACLANSASISAGDPTEIALLLAAQNAGITRENLLQTHEILDEIPFDSERKRMSILVKLPKGTFLYAKGAPDVIAALSHSIWINGKSEPLTDSLRKEVEDQIQEFAKEGLRVLACAFRPALEGKMPDEADLTLVGLIAMHDPPREGVKKTLQKCKEARMHVLMLTGDHKETAIAIAKELGIFGKALEGKEMDQMSDEELGKELEEIKVLARVSAKHKMRIIDLFQKKGEVVAMTGDGVNDAPAIEKADIGIAMGITGTDVTKSVSDLIILDDNFNTIVHAIEEGRAIYDNIVKFTSYLFSCNLAEVLIVFSSLFFLEKSGLILTPIHLLWINIVTDGLPAIALAFDPLSPKAMKSPPRDPKAPLFSKGWFFRLVGMGVLISILTIAIFLFALPYGVIHARTMAFTSLVIFELSKPYLLRLPYHVGLKNRWLFGAVLLSLLFQIGVVYLPMLHIPFETASMSLIDWGWILGGLAILWTVGYPLMRNAKNEGYH